MNLPILATAILLTLALFAHFCVGTRETAGLRPAENDSKRSPHSVGCCSFAAHAVQGSLKTVKPLFQAAYSDNPKAA